MEIEGISEEFFQEAQVYAQGIVDGLNTSVSPFHSVQTVKALLDENGFEQIKNTESWVLEAGKNYYVTRNNTSLCAFSIGEKCELAVPPEVFKIVGCHTDSPCIRLAPITKMEKEGFNQMAIQHYGGGIWQTWLDRDLTLAGRIIIKDPVSGKLEDKFWHHPDPILRIPNLAIHLQNADERTAFKYNEEKDLRPVIATAIIDALMDKVSKEEEQEEEEKVEEKPNKFKNTILKKHLKSFLELMASEIGTEPDNILDFELCMVDTNKSTLMGIHKEFISSGRLDNMLSSLVATHALIEVSKDAPNDKSVNLIYLFDHEEIGSTSDQGARSTFVTDTCQRIYASFNGSVVDVGYNEALRRSLVISADMGHAVHPNFPDRHQELHRPRLHGGVILKTNCETKYMTDSVGAAIVREIAAMHDVPLQDFICKQDMGCGSTIGPALASVHGFKTVDIGALQLAMHSCKEF